VAKGVRKTKSRFGGRLEPLTHVSLLLYEGRELDVVTQADTLDSFRTLHDDLGRMTDALALVEAVDQIAQEREANVPLYQMLRGALHTLAERPSPLLVAGFYWKLLSIEGIQPLLDCCAHCGSGGDGEPVDLVAFDLTEGGALCRACRRGHPVSAGALVLIRRILGGDLNRVLAEPASPTGHEVANLATLALEGHLERRLRAVRLLDRA
jgi:DNA repair protein RecO (recombination protein O)